MLSLYNSKGSGTQTFKVLWDESGQKRHLALNRFLRQHQ